MTTVTTFRDVLDILLLVSQGVLLSAPVAMLASRFFLRLLRHFQTPGMSLSRFTSSGYTQDYGGVRPALSYPFGVPTWEMGGLLRWTVMVASIALALFTVGMFYVRYLAIRAPRLLRTEAVFADARVTGKRTFAADDGKVYYDVSYALIAPAGGRRVEVERSERVPEDFYNHVEKGGDIEVIYAQSDPTVVRIRALYNPGGVNFSVVLSGCMIVFSLALLWTLQTPYQKVRRLEKLGVTALAVLVDCVKYETAGVTLYLVAYELPGTGPLRHEVSQKDYARLHIGQAIKVLYLFDESEIFRPLWDE
ncbi:MAG: hypothetical protein JXA21_16625 [Anaerolineae bacterium]|nr:hypothetical protein [Anaerolineae bacterium]